MSSRVRLRLWSEPLVIARLAGVPAAVPSAAIDGPPVCLTVGHGEVTLVAPRAVVDGCGVTVEEVSDEWRAITLDVVLPFGAVGVLAAASRVLAEVGVSVVVLSSYRTDHLLVPARQVGRALAALRHANLERVVPSWRGR